MPMTRVESSFLRNVSNSAICTSAMLPMETYLFRPTRPLPPAANKNELPNAPLCVSRLIPPLG